MRISKVLLICVFTIISAIALQTSSNAEQRFGPWLYYAPYYFPPDGCCLGYCFGPDDFRPRYESPNPPLPCHDVGACLPGPRTAPYPQKVSSRQQVSRPAPAMAPVPRSSRSDRTVVPAGISSLPPDRNQLSSSGGSLQQPRSITHPGPQTSDPGPRTVTRPLKWGQDRAR
jgi:hypothetical protein